MDRPPLILGLESSCDDPAAALLRGREVLSSVVMGQAELHAAFGGVVPEIAARAHAEKLDLAVERALEDAGVTLPRPVACSGQMKAWEVPADALRQIRDQLRGAAVRRREGCLLSVLRLIMSSSPVL